MESGGGGISTRSTEGVVIRMGDGDGGMEKGGSSTGTTDRTAIRMGAAPPLPVAPSRKRPLDGSGPPLQGVPRATLLPDSSHRDGSILSKSCMWHKLYRMNKTDETWLEPMMLSKATDCSLNSRACQKHLYCHMLQIYSLKLAYSSADTFDGPIQLYGYLAARDLLNPRRNYVFNRTRDDPFVVVQDDDQLIQMSGPKRGIHMDGNVVIEFDMWIKTGEKEEDDLQLIDGAFSFGDVTIAGNSIITRRIEGECGAVDISLSLIRNAAEATIQIGISEMCGSGLSLYLTACGSGILDQVRLFDGVITKPCDLNRFVFAVTRRSKLILTLKVGQDDGSDGVNRYLLFDCKQHGYSTISCKLGFATIQVKVTWSTVDIPSSVIGEDNHYPWEESDLQYVDYDYRWDDF